MTFRKFKEDGTVLRHKVVVDSQKAIKAKTEKILTEQNHKGAVDINKIVAKHGIDRIAQSVSIQNMTFDSDPTNNFQEMMQMLAKGKQAFESLPHEVRDEFHHDAARYMDYVQNPENHDAMVARGWLNPPEPEPAPVEVIMINPEPAPDPAPT